MESRRVDWMEREISIMRETQDDVTPAPAPTPDPVISLDVLDAPDEPKPVDHTAGFTVEALDVDPESALAILRTHRPDTLIVSCTRWQFTPTTEGYVVLLYTKPQA